MDGLNLSTSIDWSFIEDVGPIAGRNLLCAINAATALLAVLISGILITQ
ncbi:MAG: hypothetical protein LBQ00_03325 [Syntrophobacterales bacterium]|jgi:hypothetical protein|nr:hypothetical protein [Syntrophobacterales bacterium]